MVLLKIISSVNCIIINNNTGYYDIRNLKFTKHFQRL